MGSQRKPRSVQRTGGATPAVRITSLTERELFPPRATGAAGLHLRRCNGEEAKGFCELCEVSRDNDMAPAPGHVVHPVTNKPRVYDIYGNAKCPNCGAI